MFLERAATFVTTDIVGGGARETAGAGVVADIWHDFFTVFTRGQLVWIRYYLSTITLVFRFFFAYFPGWGKDKRHIFQRSGSSLLFRS